MKTETTLLASHVEVYRDHVLIPYKVERECRSSYPDQMAVSVGYVVHCSAFSFASGIDGSIPSDDRYRTLEGAIATTKLWIDWNESNFAELL